jgi:HK97 family phage portal protein
MIFGRDYRNQQVTDLSDVKTLMQWLGMDPDSINISGKNSLKEITVFTCIKILSDTMSKLPLKIYQDKDGVRKATGHYLYPLLKLRPNPYMSASDFWKCIETQRNLYGNSYAWPEVAERGRNAGKIHGIYPLDSTKMKIYVDDAGLLSSKNTVWYVYTDNAGKQYKMQADEILHFKGVTVNGIIGLNPIDTLRSTIENAKSSSQYINEFFKNGLQTKGIIQYTGTMSPEAENTFRERFEQMASGLKNAHRISLLPYGYQFQPIKMSLVDAQFLENSKLTVRQLAAAYGVKMHQINDLEKSNYNNMTEQQREFYVDTLQAILKMYEDELTYKLFLDSEIMNGFYSKFNVDVILRADIKTRYEAYKNGVQGGFLRPNEVREKEELEPDPAGDRLYANGNMIPLEMAGKQYTKGGKNSENTGTQE